MNRRNFFQRLTALAAAPLLVRSNVRPIERKSRLRTIIPYRTYSARVRITAEMLRGPHDSAFSTFVREDFRRLAEDIERHEWSALQRL